MKTIIILGLFFSLFAIPLLATPQEMICTPVHGETEYKVVLEQLDNGQIIVPNNSQVVEKYVETNTCFDSYVDLAIRCTNADLLSTQKNGSCTTVRCGNGNDTITALACEKHQFYWFGPQYVEVYRLTPKNGLEVCFGDNCVGEYGFARSAYLPYCREPEQQEQLDCIAAIGQEKLRGSIVNGTAIFTNDATVAFNVSAAVYNQYNDVIEDQDLYDWSSAVVEPNSTLRLPLNLPDCAWQYDMVCGGIISDFDDEHYGDKNIYWEYSTNLTYCEENEKSSNNTVIKALEDIFNFSDNKTQANNETQINMTANMSTNNTEINETPNNETTQIIQTNTTNESTIENESASNESLIDSVVNETQTILDEIFNESDENESANVSVALNVSVNSTVNTTNVT